MFILLVYKLPFASTRTGQKPKQAKYVSLFVSLHVKYFLAHLTRHAFLGQLMFIKSLSKKALYMVDKVKGEFHGSMQAQAFV